MKILITSGIFPPDIGGPSRMIEQLALDLHLKGIGVKVLAFGQEDQENRPYQVFKASGKFSFFYQLWKLAKEVEIIYTFDLYTAGFLSWLIGKKIFKKKLVIRFAGDSAWEAASNKGYIIDDITTFQTKNYGSKITWLKKLRSWILRGADKVVAVSHFMKGIAEKIGVPAERIEVIYNSIDFIKSYEDELGLVEKLHLGNKKVIVTGGRLVPWKGIDGLMAAVAQLSKDQNFASLCLLIFGDGPDRARLERSADIEGIREQVLFVGRISLNKIFNYYNLADIFVLNSQYEGLSHILLEVLTLGKPIIASNCGGNPEVIENEKNGLLVEYNNVDQLKLAIKRVLTEPYWQSVEYKKTCQESLEKFNWSKNIEETFNLFRNLEL